ncbi:MAG: hypothetical protein L0Z53_04675 [Acidobacteriales bacterium]|nr:hypothetical protein [Terriglobales bacterium]
MSAPAPVAIHELEAPETTIGSTELKSSAGRQPDSLRRKLFKWLQGWKQTVIAELASLGSPKEGFL